MTRDKHTLCCSGRNITGYSDWQHLLILCCGCLLLFVCLLLVLLLGATVSLLYGGQNAIAAAASAGGAAAAAVAALAPALGSCILRYESRGIARKINLLMFYI